MAQMVRNLRKKRKEEDRVGGENGLHSKIGVDLERQQPCSQPAMYPATGEMSCAFLWPPQNLGVIYILAESQFA